MILAVPRHEHAMAALRMPLGGVARRILSWIQETCTWSTGLMRRLITARGLAAELRAELSAVKRGLAKLRAAEILVVYRRGPRYEPYYALILPGRPLRVVQKVVERVGSALGRFADRVKSVVAAGMETVRELVDEPRSGHVAPMFAAPERVVPFTGGRGPTPTIIARPSFSEATRGDGYARLEDPAPERRVRGGDPERFGGALAWLDPGPPPSTWCDEPGDDDPDDWFTPDPEYAYIGLRPEQRKQPSHERHVASGTQLAAPAVRHPRGSRRCSICPT